METTISRINQNNTGKIIYISIDYDHSFSQPVMSAGIEYKENNLSETNKIDIQANKEKLDALIKTIQYITKISTHIKTDDPFISDHEIKTINIKFYINNTHASSIWIDVTKSRKTHPLYQRTKHIKLDNHTQAEQIKEIKDVLISFIEQAVANNSNNIEQDKNN